MPTIDLDAIRKAFDNADYRLDSSDPWEPNEVQPLYAAGIALVAHILKLEVIVRCGRDYVDAVRERAPMTWKSLLFDEFAAAVDSLTPATATEGGEAS
jgi:hypothetical protein